jgi:hypothetical protein
MHLHLSFIQKATFIRDKAKQRVGGLSKTAEFSPSELAQVAKFCGMDAGTSMYVWNRMATTEDSVFNLVRECYEKYLKFELKGQKKPKAKKPTKREQQRKRMFATTTTSIEDKVRAEKALADKFPHSNVLAVFTSIPVSASEAILQKIVKGQAALKDTKQVRLYCGMIL